MAGDVQDAGATRMLIDLHSHTNRSDGSLSPAQLLQLAYDSQVGCLAITDHDTFAGYDCARPIAASLAIDLICGIEISAKIEGKSAHVLAYFLNDDESHDCREWIQQLEESRRDRNVRLACRLKEHGINVTAEEVQQRSGAISGRPHFAQILVEKGYAKSIHEAFEKYLGERAITYVERNELQMREAVQKIRREGGIASLAHPVRLERDLAATVSELIVFGLNAIEAYHSDHTPAQTRLYLDLAKRYRLLVTGGSDFHGSTKPEVKLGSGRQGNLHVPLDVLERLRSA